MPLVTSSRVHVFKKSLAGLAPPYLRDLLQVCGFYCVFSGIFIVCLMTLVYNVCMYFVQPVQHFGQLRFF